MTKTSAWLCVGKESVAASGGAKEDRAASLQPTESQFAMCLTGGHGLTWEAHGAARDLKAANY